MAFSNVEIEELAQKTIGQSDNPLWRKERIGRLFSSLMIRVINIANTLHPYKGADFQELPWFLKKRIYWLRKCLIQFNRLDGIPEIDWGNIHEKDGISSYVTKTGYIIQETGLWLSPSGFLTCSPDGLVFINEKSKYPEGILEVKCPYKLRNFQKIQSSDSIKSLSYIDFNLKIYSGHKFYHRAKSEIYATRTSWCDFLIWAPAGVLITGVERDEEWIETNIPLVEDMYETYLLPTSPIRSEIISRRIIAEKEKMKNENCFSFRKKNSTR